MDLKHNKIYPVENQLFHVQTPNGKNGLFISHLDNVPDYRAEIIAKFQDGQSGGSQTHKTFHGQPRGKMSYEIELPTIKAEYLKIIREQVVAHAPKFNYAGRTPTLFAQQLLLYEPGKGCVVHCDDQDSSEREYGLGTVVFNWGNQLIALLFISTQGVDYEGGELIFPNAMLDIEGEFGKLVVCPGHYKYKHGVADIVSGYRLVVQTTWRFDV